ncbi:hypothetical protein [uncultured Arcticibacterium sp.]|uniref:hypothetical protein n=1 Tax=uncultured Arcticibacterium sp. TaxID=2173042 RepID=UPI0030FB688D
MCELKLAESEIQTGVVLESLPLVVDRIYLDETDLFFVNEKWRLRIASSFKILTKSGRLFKNTDEEIQSLLKAMIGSSIIKIESKSDDPLFDAVLHFSNSKVSEVFCLNSYDYNFNQ